MTHSFGSLALGAALAWVTSALAVGGASRTTFAVVLGTWASGLFSTASHLECSEF